MNKNTYVGLALAIGMAVISATSFAADLLDSPAHPSDPSPELTGTEHDKAAAPKIISPSLKSR
jgi:hypothetical protein